MAYACGTIACIDRSPFILQPLSPIMNFICKRTPALVCGSGRCLELPELLRPYGRKVLLLTGGRSFVDSGHWPLLKRQLADHGYLLYRESIRGEPSPEEIDGLCARYQQEDIGSVVAIGGGSVLDGGKAVAAMLVEQQPVSRFLEGVGTAKPSGTKRPFIAVPTTSGTGSEATSNAVLSHIGPDGFKKSLRHDGYIPDIAVLDPSLTISCPPAITAACGLDAFSQLLEGYLSTKGSPFTDLLALEGIRRLVRSLVRCFQEGRDADARADLSYAAYLSGIVLTNAGLGAVHGLASPLGGMFPIPHGVVCGTLMAQANAITLDRLRAVGSNPGALAKYALLGKVVSGNDMLGDQEAQDVFIDYLQQLAKKLEIAPLSAYGIGPADVSRIVDQADSKYNPVTLAASDLAEILRARIMPVSSNAAPNGKNG